MAQEAPSAAIPFHPDRARSTLTVIVPTRNESGNIAELLRRLEIALAGIEAEVLFVDDSTDDTPAQIQDLAASAAWPVRLLHRPAEDRTGGLGGAVLAGLRATRAEYVVVMDGDLQHPPEVVPRLFETARAGFDVVVASRYCHAGAVEGFSSLRSGLSNLATLLAKATFPRRLRATTDPMSGFFALRTASLRLDQLRPTGFKILLEILVGTPGLRLTEYPFTFGSRLSGESKAGVREGTRFARQLLRLRRALPVGPRARRTVRAVAFGAVGASGIVVNTAALWLLASTLDVQYLAAAAAATQLSTVWNFAWTEAVVFHGPKPRSRLARLAAFAAVNNLALLLRLPVLALLVTAAALPYLTANVLTLLGVFLARFFVTDSLIYRRGEPMSQPIDVIRTRPPVDVIIDLVDRLPAPNPIGPRGLAGPASQSSPLLPYRYQLHGLVSLASEVALRELACFRDLGGSGRADIEIRSGSVGGAPRRRARMTQYASPAAVLYEEQLGRHAANFQVRMGDHIEVTASPMLMNSPHVLYTNIIEALLRFVLVSRGHVLLHGACLDLGGTGVMLSARTDTGKTGTILRLLRENDARFLSDDMTILTPGGVAYCFPKPLTISHHTLRAVQAGDLSRQEWRKLRLQSRLHSKEGRGIGQWLGDHNVPIMAFNAVTQYVVPPPKYAIERLVPTVTASTVKVSEVFVIERGSQNLVEVPLGDALIDTLIENTDDAYGFPPFRYFAPALVIGGDDYTLLRTKERMLLESAMANVRVRRLATDDFTWADRIPALVAPEVTRPLDIAPRQRRPIGNSEGSARVDANVLPRSSGSHP